MRRPSAESLEDTRILGEPGQLASFDRLIARDPRMLACIDQAMRIAQVEVAVMIYGETGTGKNALAEAVHCASHRCQGPCRRVNVCEFSENLLESEIFGHVRGAYTGAHSDRRGCFELTNGGTLVLDEVAEVGKAIQAKLLRVVETGQYEKVGGEETLHANVRLITLTNTPPAELVRSGRLREDLLYRLKESYIELPPLRERKEDIPVLAERFIQHYSAKFGKRIKGLSGPSLEFALTHHWPGNVRELQGMLKRAMVLAEGDALHLDLGPELASKLGAAGQEEVAGGDLSMGTAERRHIVKVLKLTAGNKRRAAEMLKISRTTLDKKLKDYGIPE